MISFHFQQDNQEILEKVLHPFSIEAIYVYMYTYTHTSTYSYYLPNLLFIVSQVLLCIISICCSCTFLFSQYFFSCLHQLYQLLCKILISLPAYFINIHTICTFNCIWFYKTTCLEREKFNSPLMQSQLPKVCGFNKYQRQLRHYDPISNHNNLLQVI